MRTRFRTLSSTTRRNGSPTSDSTLLRSRMARYLGPCQEIPGPLQGMMRSLLADRFKLAVHRETRDFPVYALQLARSDRRLGPQLHASPTDCAALPASGQPQRSPDEKPRCGVRASGGHMHAGGLPVAQLATLLSTMVDRTVVDRTGLLGAFDFE